MRRYLRRPPKPATCSGSFGMTRMNNKSLTLCIGFFLLAGCGTVQVDVEFDSSPTPPGSGFATSAASFPTQTATSTVASPASAVSSPAASDLSATGPWRNTSSFPRNVCTEFPPG